MSQATRPRVGSISKHAEDLARQIEHLKRERVLDAAARLFYKKGFSATTIEDISTSLGMTKPYVYQFYPSKLSLLEEICETGTREVLKVVQDRTAAEGSPSERLRALVEDFTAAALDRQRFVTIYFRESVHLPEATAQRIKNARLSVDSMLTALIHEGNQTGEFDVEDPYLSALTIAGMMSYTFAWYRPGAHFDKHEVCRRMGEQVLRLVRKLPSDSQ